MWNPLPNIAYETKFLKNSQDYCVVQSFKIESSRTEEI